MSALDEIVRGIIEKYDAGNQEDAALASLIRKIREGKATYGDVERLASQTGTRAGQLIAAQLAELAVDGRVTDEQARALLMGMTRHNYDIVSGAAADVQERLNQRAGLGLKAVRPEFNQDRVEGLIIEVVGKEDVPAFRKTLTQQVENVSMATVDDSVKVNAKAHYNAGLLPKIKRVTDGKCCEWCNKLAGVYDYYQVNNTGNDVFRRHANCGCQVLYDPADGTKWQDVHSKRLLSADERAKIEARTRAGLETQIDGIPKSWKNNLKVSDDEVLNGTNPGYKPFIGEYTTKKDIDYNSNCSNCVPAYEMRCRGYNVIARPLSENKSLRSNPFLAWNNPHPILNDVHGGVDIVRYLSSLPDGSRVQIVATKESSIWLNGSGHTFVGEKTTNGVRFVDPQSGNIIKSVEDSLSKFDTVEYMRIDDLELSDKGISACANETKR